MLTVASPGMRGDAASMAGESIIVVDDDPGLRDLVGDYLSANGFAVRTADGVAALRAELAVAPADCIILDVMMPVEDGLSALRSLNGAGGAAIVILSTLASDIDRIVGIEMGADDYVAKPCNPRELLARVRAVLRRRNRHDAAPVPGTGWTISKDHWTLTAPDGSLVDVTSAELRLIALLAEAKGRVLSRDRLVEQLHGDSDNFDRAIDVAISRIRRKLDAAGGEQLIRTVRGQGYALGMPVSMV